MRSPFPGRDPYLEQTRLWSDFCDRIEAMLRIGGRAVHELRGDVGSPVGQVPRDAARGLSLRHRGGAKIHVASTVRPNSV
ncbi:MAG: DUF4058 family protein [Planctomycetaceae bacterium]